MSGPLFSFEDVVVDRGGRRVLDGIELTIDGDGLTAVVGRSGSGKSTLLRCCNRLDVPVAGVVRYRGHDLAGLDPLVHRRRVGMIFQAPVAFPGSVRDNLAAADPGLEPSVAIELLDRVGLPAAMLDRTADTLSGGEAQRMSIARALATGPEVLLADEATSALDEAARGHLEHLARRLVDDGLPVIWVSHDRAQVRRIADRTVIVDGGRLRWVGPTDDPEADEVLAELTRDRSTPRPDGAVPDDGIEPGAAS